jgi:hypothetical protein
MHLQSEVLLADDTLVGAADYGAFEHGVTAFGSQARREPDIAQRNEILTIFRLRDGCRLGDPLPTMLEVYLEELYICHVEEFLESALNYDQAIPPLGFPLAPAASRQDKVDFRVHLRYGNTFLGTPTKLGRQQIRAQAQLRHYQREREKQQHTSGSQHGPPQYVTSARQLGISTCAGSQPMLYTPILPKFPPHTSPSF